MVAHQRPSRRRPTAVPVTAHASSGPHTPVTVPPSLQANLERRAADIEAMRAIYRHGIHLLSGEPLCFLVRHGARCEREPTSRQPVSDRFSSRPPAVA